MKSRLYRLLERVSMILNHAQLKRMHANRRPSEYLYERSLEYAFALDAMPRHQVLDVLDVGTGTNAFAATLEHCGYNVTASDLMGDYWSAFHNRHIYVVKDDITHSDFDSQSFDAVNCISTLEHIDDYHSAITHMVRVLRPNGILILTFPYSYDEFCENVYALDTADAVSRAFPYAARSFSNAELTQWCEEFGLEIVETRYIRGWEGKFWRSGRRIAFPYEVQSMESANCICVAMRKQ